MDKQTGRQTDRLTSGQTDRQTNRQTNKRTDRQAGKQTNRQRKRQTLRQTDKPMDKSRPNQTRCHSVRQAFNSKKVIKTDQTSRQLNPVGHGSHRQADRSRQSVRKFLRYRFG